MSEYVDRKAREALEEADGDARRAASLLESWTSEDARLKSALIRPFLPNICRLAIQRSTAQRSTTKPGAREAKAKVKGTAMDLVIEALYAKSGKTRKPEPAIPQPPPKPAAASPKHTNAMQALASSYKRKV